MLQPGLVQRLGNNLRIWGQILRCFIKGIRAYDPELRAKAKPALVLWQCGQLWLQTATGAIRVIAKEPQCVHVPAGRQQPKSLLNQRILRIP